MVAIILVVSNDVITRLRLEKLDYKSIQLNPYSLSEINKNNESNALSLYHFHAFASAGFSIKTNYLEHHINVVLDPINSLRSASFPLSQIWLLSFSIIIVSINHFFSFSIRVLSNKSCVLPFHDLLARSKVCHGGCNEEPPTVQLLLRDMALKGRRRDIAMTHLWRNTH